MNTVHEIISGPFEFNARKHGLGDEYAENYIDKMSNNELLWAISEAIESRLTKTEIFSENSKIRINLLASRVEDMDSRLQQLEESVARLLQNPNA